MSPLLKSNSKTKGKASIARRKKNSQSNEAEECSLSKKSELFCCKSKASNIFQSSSHSNESSPRKSPKCHSPRKRLREAKDNVEESETRNSSRETRNSSRETRNSSRETRNSSRETKLREKGEGASSGKRDASKGDPTPKRRGRKPAPKAAKGAADSPSSSRYV